MTQHQDPDLGGILLPVLAVAGLLLLAGGGVLVLGDLTESEPRPGDVVLQNVDGEPYQVTLRASTVGDTDHEVDGETRNRTTVTVPPNGTTVEGFITSVGRYDLDIEGEAGIGRHYGLYLCRKSGGGLGGPTIVVSRDEGQGDAYRAVATTGSEDFCETTPTFGPATRDDT